MAFVTKCLINYGAGERGFTKTIGQNCNCRLPVLFSVASSAVFLPLPVHRIPQFPDY